MICLQVLGHKLRRDRSLKPHGGGVAAHRSQNGCLQEDKGQQVLGGWRKDLYHSWWWGGWKETGASTNQNGASSETEN